MQVNAAQLNRGKGYQVPKRSKEMKHLHAQLLPLLRDGISPAALEKQYGVKADTLRKWKYKAFGRVKREHPAIMGLDGISETTAVATEVAEKITGEVVVRIKEVLSQQSLIPIVTVAGMRHGIPKGLEEFDKAIRKNLSNVVSMLCDGVTVTNEQDEKQLIPLDMNQSKSAARATADLLKQYCHLHCLPLGPQEIDAFAIGSVPAAQHLHYHAHGARRLPERAEAPRAQASEPGEDAEGIEALPADGGHKAMSEVIDVTPERSESVSDNQGILLDLCID